MPYEELEFVLEVMAVDWIDPLSRMLACTIKKPICWNIGNVKRIFEGRMHVEILEYQQIISGVK